MWVEITVPHPRSVAHQIRGRLKPAGELTSVITGGGIALKSLIDSSGLINIDNLGQYATSSTGQLTLIGLTLLAVGTGLIVNRRENRDLMRLSGRRNRH